MSEESEPNEPNEPNEGKTQQVNLQQVAGQFMSGLQRHFDMLAFNLAAREAASEEAYNKRSHAPRIMPAARHHQNFEQMQAYARDLLVRQVIGDALNLAVTGMNNAHFFLALVQATRGSREVSKEAQQSAQERQKAFANAQLDEKFNRLEQDYGIMCEAEDTITSLGFALQALGKQGGIVKARQLDDKGELVIELKGVSNEAQPSTDGQSGSPIVTHRKIFREGESIVFSDVELQLILVTLASFADSLFKSVAGFARSNGHKNDGT